MPEEILAPLVRPLGLVTQPNKMGQYDPGALRTASGIYIRDPGVCSQESVFVQQIAGTWASNCTAFELIPVDQQTQFKYMTWALGTDLIWRYAWDNNATQTVIIPSSFYTTVTENLQPGTTYDRLRGYTINGRRLIIPAVAATIAFDLVPTGTPASRVAGLPAPTIRDCFLLNTAAGAPIAAGSHAQYAAVIRRTFADGVELVSAPSAAAWLKNGNGTDYNTQINVRINNACATGDYVDVYRTKTQVASVNLGADYYLVGSVLVASGGFSQIVTVLDNTSDSSLGKALYTNSGVLGAAAANRMPPLCNSICTFKGYTFYLGCTDLPGITLRVGSAMASFGLSSAATAQYRKYGIGTRSVAGNCVSGAFQLTGCSAADLVGVVIGQDVTQYTGAISAGAAQKVTAVGASTITFDTAFNATGAGTLSVTDIIEIDALRYEIFTFDALLTNIGGATYGGQTVAIECLDRVLMPSALLSLGSVNGTIPSDSFSIYRPYSANGTPYTAAMTIRATNGANYTPPLPKIETNDTAQSIPIVVRKNMGRWSEQNNADAAPIINNFFCGVGDLYRGYSTRDAMWIFASDGLWRLSGTGGRAGAGYDWRLDPVDSTLILSGPRCGCVLRDTVYAYTNRGFVSIDSSGTVREISQGRIQDLMPGPAWSDTQPASVWFDEANDEITVKTELGTVFYVFNVLTDAFTVLITNGTPLDGAFIRSTQRVAYVNGNGVFEQSGSFSGVASSVNYQPVYGEDPFATHEWQSMDLVFDSANEGASVTSVVNAVAGAARTLNDPGISFARAGYGIGRNAPARATCIAPGWSVSAGITTMLRFFGAGLHKKTITQQRIQR